MVVMRVRTDSLCRERALRCIKISLSLMQHRDEVWCPDPIAPHLVVVVDLVQDEPLLADGVGLPDAEGLPPPHRILLVHGTAHTLSAQSVQVYFAGSLLREQKQRTVSAISPAGTRAGSPRERQE